MKEILKHSLISLGASFLLYELQELIGSSYISSFLKLNLITIILALLAINSTTLGIVLTKIRELIDSEKRGVFEKSKKQMLISIKEQIALVIISLVLFTMSDSIAINKNTSISLLINVFCIATFVYDLLILYDTSKSVFVIIDFNKQ